MRGDGVVEDVDGDCPPQYGRVVGDDDDDYFPLREGSKEATIDPLYLWVISEGSNRGRAGVSTVLASSGV